MASSASSPPSVRSVSSGRSATSAKWLPSTCASTWTSTSTTPKTSVTSPSPPPRRNCWYSSDKKSQTYLPPHSGRERVPQTGVLHLYAVRSSDVLRHRLPHPPIVLHRHCLPRRSHRLDCIRISGHGYRNRYQLPHHLRCQIESRPRLQNCIPSRCWNGVRTRLPRATR